MPRQCCCMPVVLCVVTAAESLVMYRVQEGHLLALAAEGINFYYKEQIRQGRTPPNSQVVLPVSFAMSSALIGTQSVVQAKALSECVEQLGKGVIVFTHLYFWMALFLFVSLVAIWLTRLTKARHCLCPRSSALLTPPYFTHLVPPSPPLSLSLWKLKNL